MDPLSALIAGGLSLIGGLFGNSSSADQAGKAFERQQTLNLQQYNLGREARQTAYQDEMSSMKAAGLNPMLAYMQAPQGVSTSAGSAPMAQVRDPITPAVSSAMEAAQTSANISLNSASADKAKADADTSRAQGDFIRQQSAILQRTGALPGQNPTTVAGVPYAPIRSAAEWLWGNAKGIGDAIRNHGYPPMASPGSSAKSQGSGSPPISGVQIPGSAKSLATAPVGSYGSVPLGWPDSGPDAGHSGPGAYTTSGSSNLPPTTSLRVRR